MTTTCDFLVTVQPSARTFTAHADETVLAAAIRQGVTLPYGCKDGACGSCKCLLVAGQVENLPHAEQALSPHEKSQGFILTCRAKAETDITLESRQVSHESAFPIRKMPVRVSQMEALSADVMRLVLQLPAQQNFQYHAGQFVEFVLKDGARRAYSMATPPHAQADAPSLELHIRHLSGGKFTDQVFSTLQPRDILRIEGPFGSFVLHDDAQHKPLILLATGTGFAPVKAMLEHLQHTGNTRPVFLYWGGRTLADLYLHDWLEAFVATLPQIHYTAVLSQPHALWQGKSGYILEALRGDFPDLSNCQVYACGSPTMVAAAEKLAIRESQLPPEHFFADAFTSEADKAMPPTAPDFL